MNTNARNLLIGLGIVIALYLTDEIRHRAIKLMRKCKARKLVLELGESAGRLDAPKLHGEIELLLKDRILKHKDIGFRDEEALKLHAAESLVRYRREMRKKSRFLGHERRQLRRQLSEPTFADKPTARLKWGDLYFPRLEAHNNWSRAFKQLRGFYPQLLKA